MLQVNPARSARDAALDPTPMMRSSPGSAPAIKHMSAATLTHPLECELRHEQDRDAGSVKAMG
jgi:hypothetical protein